MKKREIADCHVREINWKNNRNLDDKRTTNDRISIRPIDLKSSKMYTEELKQLVIKINYQPLGQYKIGLPMSEYKAGVT